MDGCLRERFLLVYDFLPQERAVALRADIDAHFDRPAEHKPDTHQVWNYWFVPGSYTYLRTTPEKVIGRERVEQFVNDLRDWAARNLGLANVTWPYLSLYVPGCVQGLHNDSVNGSLGFVYSLTRNDRRTLGGETLLMHERDLFRSSLNSAAAGTDLFDLVEPRFNRLTLFDDRIPHAVQRVDGPMDPREGRFVLHGHISEAGVTAQGTLPPDAIQNEIVGLLGQLRGMFAGQVHGTFVVSVEIGAGGQLTQMRPIVDRLASANGADLELVRRAIAERLQAIRFPAADGPTRANIPLVF